MEFGSVTQGMMTRHQDNKQRQVYRRHVAQELLMELTLVHKGDALQKMTAADLFLPNVANARMPSIGEGDSHSHKASISSAQQEEMADAMRESQDTTNSMNLNPRWPAAMPLPTWNASLHVDTTKRLAKDGSVQRQQTPYTADNKQAALAKRMCNTGWAIIADSGDMDVNGKQGTTIMRQLLSLQQMLQRCVSMEQVDSKDNTAMVTVHLGMWPHCNADACQDVLASGHVTHVHFPELNDLGISK